MCATLGERLDGQVSAVCRVFPGRCHICGIHLPSDLRTVYLSGYFLIGPNNALILGGISLQHRSPIFVPLIDKGTLIYMIGRFPQIEISRKTSLNWNSVDTFECMWNFASVSL